MKKRFPLAISLDIWSWMGAVCANAANGTWTNPSGGSWTNNVNWSGGIIADGAGNTASFSTLTLPADTIVTLHAPRTIGNLIFDDQNVTKHNWSLIPGGGNQLTLAGGAPTITVGSATTTINAVLAGALGFTKAGAGKLVLGTANTYSGTTLVSAGTLTFATVIFSTNNPLSVAAGAVAESAATLKGLFVEKI